MGVTAKPMDAIFGACALSWFLGVLRRAPGWPRWDSGPKCAHHNKRSAPMHLVIWRIVLPGFALTAIRASPGRAAVPPGVFRALVWFSGLNLLLVSVLWPGLEAQFMEHCRPAGSGGRDLAANAATNQTRNDEGVLALPCSSASFCVRETVLKCRSKSFQLHDRRLRRT